MDLLDKLGKENNIDIKDFKLDDKLSKNVEEIIDAYEKILKKFLLGRLIEYEINRYWCCEQNIPKNYSSRDITFFSIKLEEIISKWTFPDYLYYSTTGLFISALINNCNDAKYNIFTLDWKDQLYDIGYELDGCKEINIIGNVGSVGKKMQNGIINISGDVKNIIGESMGGGMIIVKGSVSYFDVNVKLIYGEVIIENNNEYYVDYYCKTKDNKFIGKVPKNKFSELRNVLKNIG